MHAAYLPHLPGGTEADTGWGTCPRSRHHSMQGGAESPSLTPAVLSCMGIPEIRSSPRALVMPQGSWPGI